MQAPAPRSTNWTLIIIIGAIVLCACVVVVALSTGAVYYLLKDLGIGTPGAPSADVTPQATVAVNRPPVTTVSSDTADALSAAIVPVNDPYDLACRLKGVCDASRTVPAPAKPYKVGDTRKFWLQNSDTQENFQVEASLRFITPHSYFWLQNGVDAKDSDIAALMNTFEDKIYPTDRKFFGSEWTPGVDNDPHVYVLYVRGVGSSVGGYYSPPDELNPAVRKESNAAELFVFNADGEALDDEYTYGTLAHEFQHMIHWTLDENETSWLNEGSSEVAAFLNGYTVGGWDYSYVQSPNIPLLDWPSLSDDPDLTGNHYGQAFLFMTYFLDRFGNEATQALVKDPENSLTSVDDVLKNLSITDKQTGQPITANDLAMDWMVTLYLQDGNVGDGRYVYHNYPNAPKASATQTISDCPGSPLNASVSQYGPEYIEISCTGDHTVSFSGSTVASLLPADPHSGKYAFWSNFGDSSDMMLTREFDFTSASSPLNFSYWTWYDLEKGYDYLYLEASTDGQHWDILHTPSCFDKDKSGNAYGCGYNNKSGGGNNAKWIQEQVDLSAYAGKKVQLRFEYVTDAAVNGQGLLLDDLSIPAVNYTADFEDGDGGWKAEGWARIQNALPQTFRIALIKQAGDQTTVEPVAIADDQTATFPVSLKSGETAVIVLTGTQRFTRLPAGYTVEVK